MQAGKKRQKLPPHAHAFREGFYQELQTKKDPFVAALNASSHAYIQTPATLQVVFQRYLQDMDEINRVYGRPEHVEDQYLIGFGQNDTGQLGIDSGEDSGVHQIPKSANSRLIEAGNISTIVIKDGRPFAMGNVRDSLADVKEETPPGPKQVKGFLEKDERKIVDVGAGSAHAIFLGMSGDVYSWGFYKDDDSGEFVDTGNCEKPKEKQPPKKVEGLGQKAMKVYANENMSAAILEDGSLVTWGIASSGMLARTAGMQNPDAQGNYDISSSFYTTITDGKKEYDMGKIREHYMTPKPVMWSDPSPSRKFFVKNVAIGMGHILVTAYDFTKATGPMLYGAGSNMAGQLGTGKNVGNYHSLHPVSGALEGKSVSCIAAGRDFSIAVTYEGITYAFGSNSYGQLGIGFHGDQSSFPLPQRVHFVADKPVVVREVAAGSYFALARTDEGKLYSWGENALSQTGNAVRTDKRSGENIDVHFPFLLNLSSVFKRNVKVMRIAAGQDHGMIIAQDIAGANAGDSKPASKTS